LKVAVDNDLDSQLAIVLPVHNEAQVVERVLMTHYSKIVSRIPSRLVVGEDGSTDDTREVLHALMDKIPMELFSAPERKGYAKTVSDLLRKVDTEWIFFSDSDGQYSPDDFWNLWNNRGQFDMIVGRKVKRRDSAYRIVLARGFHEILNFLFHLDLHDADCGFRLIRKRVVEAVIDSVGVLKYSFWAEFTIRACMAGFNVCEIPISHAMRENGGSHIYGPTKIPTIVLGQFEGLAKLYRDVMSSRFDV